MLFALFLAVTIGAVRLANSQDVVPSEQTKELCRQYADMNHKGEIAPSRWDYFISKGYNPNTDFDWYGSCIKHNTERIVD